jgi:hypothetical protein
MKLRSGFVSNSSSSSFLLIGTPVGNLDFMSIEDLAKLVSAKTDLSGMTRDQIYREACCGNFRYVPGNVIGAEEDYIGYLFITDEPSSMEADLDFMKKELTEVAATLGVECIPTVIKGKSSGL